jgi:hypothetical protein
MILNLPKIVTYKINEGKWSLSVSPKGFINHYLYLTVLEDLNAFVTEKKIQKPVLLLIDGASPHISLKAAKYCTQNQLQLGF